MLNGLFKSIWCTGLNIYAVGTNPESIQSQSMSFERVLQSGCCIGCGACAVVSPHITMAEAPDGRLTAHTHRVVDPECSIDLDLVCPFSDRACNETELARRLFGGHCKHRDEMLGWWFSTYVGFVRDDSIRQRASSGGIGRWLLAALLRQKLVDACIHVRGNTDLGTGRLLFEYTVSRSTDEVLSSARSAYCPVEMSAVLKYVLDVDGRYVITGVPCFIKAIRLLQNHVPVLAKRIVFTMGLFCGHLKSRFYAEMLAWQLGVSPTELRWIDFRDKSVSQTAKDKGIVASGIGGGTPKGPRVVGDLFGAEYGLGFFQYPACDYCDDIAAETADVVVGDAWLPEYIADPRGTSIVVVRRPEIDQLLLDGESRGELRISPIDPARIVESQAGAYRHRREGLAYRIYLDEKAGRWHPRKRVVATRSHICGLRRRIYRSRLRLRTKSVEAFLLAKKLGDFEVFRRIMEPLVRQYRRLYQPPLLQRGIRKVHRLWQRLCGVPLDDPPPRNRDSQ